MSYCTSVIYGKIILSQELQEVGIRDEKDSTNGMVQYGSGGMVKISAKLENSALKYQYEVGLCGRRYRKETSEAFSLKSTRNKGRAREVSVLISFEVFNHKP